MQDLFYYETILRRDDRYKLPHEVKGLKFIGWVINWKNDVPGKYTQCAAKEHEPVIINRTQDTIYFCQICQIYWKDFN